MRVIRLAVGAALMAAMEASCLGAAKGESARPSGNPLEFQQDLAIWTVVVFVVLLAVLWRFAWKPIVRGLDRREKGITDRIAQAEEVHRAALELKTQYEQKLAEAHEQARAIIEQARREAQQAGRELIEAARLEAAAGQERAQRRIDAAADAALRDSADRIATLAVELAGRILRVELTPEQHEILVEQALADFTSNLPSKN
jgi:F-type H+-transporting ATPase subunit b